MVSAIAVLVRVRGDDVCGGDVCGDPGVTASTACADVREGEDMSRGDGGVILRLNVRGFLVGEGVGVPDRGIMS